MNFHAEKRKGYSEHGLLRAWNSVDLGKVNSKAAISSLHQVGIPNPIRPSIKLFFISK